MPRRGENIRKRTDGRWEGRYRPACQLGQKPTIKSVYGHSYAEVKKKLANIQEEEQVYFNIADIPKSAITFETAAECWFTTIPGTKKYSTCVKYRNIYEKHLKPIIGGVPLSALNSAGFEDAVIRRDCREESEDTLSESLQRSIYSVANQVILFSVQTYHMRLAPLIFDKKNKHKRPVQVFNEEEQQKLVHYLNKELDLYKLGILLCLYTGLRIGELCSLKWEDIDFSNKVIRVNSTVQRLPSTDTEAGQRTCLVEAEPKTLFSRREIPIPENLYQRILELKHDKKYVVGIDRVADPRSYQKKFRFYLKEAGVEYKSFHTLRHTFATNCVAKGSDPKSLSEMLGHSDVKTTLNRYVHPSMDTKRAYLNLLFQ